MPNFYAIARRQNSLAEQQSGNSMEDSLSITRDVQGTTSFKATGKYAGELLPAAQNTFGTIARQCIASGTQLAQGPKHLGPKGRHPVVGPVVKPCRYGDNCTKQGCKFQHPASKQAPKQNDEVISKLIAKNKELRKELEEKDDTIRSYEQTIRDLFSELESLRKQLPSSASWADQADDQGVNQNTDQGYDQADLDAALS